MARHEAKRRLRFMAGSLGIHRAALVPRSPSRNASRITLSGWQVLLPGRLVGAGDSSPLPVAEHPEARVRPVRGERRLEVADRLVDALVGELEAAPVDADAGARAEIVVRTHGGRRIH